MTGDKSASRQRGECLGEGGIGIGMGTSRMTRCSGEAIWSALLINQEHLLSRMSVPILPINSGSP
jgi:hypothetical protein